MGCCDSSSNRCFSRTKVFLLQLRLLPSGILKSSDSVGPSAYTR